MASADEIARSIEPGSTEYGDREVLAGQLQDALGGGAAAPAGPSVGPGPAPSATTDPMAKLLGGGHKTDLPTTSGLSVGPGAGPVASQGVATSPRIDQLRAIATGAKSPYLRQLARDALRRELKRNR